ncbi:replication initiation protein [Gallibacterium anatis]|uniref:replication initiation protein n=1 Tax=Gallibacterium anatis TaxID=750 RepID=UPI0005322132|nr:replication initiation protein [Gallibacterium anatis]KGQ24761.1 replication protein [Gallibacterium anatis CCM5995]HDV0780465.1 replication initiation protein [Acinetobacter baumannii]
MNESLAVYKDNYLIEASYRLTLMEQRIMLYAISRLNPKEPQREHSFYVDELLRFFPDIEPSSAYRALREAVYKLSERWVRTEHPEYIKEFRWVSSRTYFKDEGRIDIAFTPEIMPYLSQLEKQFTKYQLKNISAFKGSYSIRLYELLTQYISTGNRTINLEDLRDWLKIEDKYPEFKEFNRCVIKPAIKEINDKSDLLVSVEPIKRGRTIYALKFTIRTKIKNTSKTEQKRPPFPHKNKYGKFVKLDKQNPGMSSAEYGNYAKDCLAILDNFYSDLDAVTLEDVRNYLVFLETNASNRSKLGKKQDFIDEIAKRGYKLVNCELVKND